MVVDAGFCPVFWAGCKKHRLPDPKPCCPDAPPQAMNAYHEAKKRSPSNTEIPLRMKQVSDRIYDERRAFLRTPQVRLVCTPRAMCAVLGWYEQTRYLGDEEELRRDLHLKQQILAQTQGICMVRASHAALA